MTVKPLLAMAPVHERTMRRIQRWARRIARAASPDIVAEPIVLGGAPGETLAPSGGPTSGLTLLYLHGGGFFTGSVASYRGLLEAFVRATGGTVHAIDYRQLPDHTVAESVQDAIAAYEDVLACAADPAKIAVAGDSAGGYLTMKIAELAARRGLRAPAALIGFSPLLSLDPDQPGSDVVRVDRVREAILPVRRIAALRELWLPAGVELEGSASVLDAVGLIDSPTHLVAVEDEFLRPEAEAFALLLDDRGVEVDMHLWRGQVHAFPLLAGRLPDADLAIEIAAEFALRHAGEPPAVRIDDAAARSAHLRGELADGFPGLGPSH